MDHYDLRPLRSDVFYARKYDLDEVILDIFKSHDIYIMPPLDIDPTQNFKIRKPSRMTPTGMSGFRAQKP